MQGKREYEWSVCVTTSRESCEVVCKCIASMVCAIGDTEAKVNVIVNGNFELAEKLVDVLGRGDIQVPGNIHLYIFHIELGDKPNALNQYFYTIGDVASYYFCSDGYVCVDRAAFDTLVEGLEADSTKMAGSGVPSAGRGSKQHSLQVVASPGLHGNLLVLTKRSVEKLIASGFHWMLSMYRTDGYLSSAVCFDFDPSANEYSNSRILVDPAAFWTFRPLSFFSLRDLKAGFDRWFRQSRGHIINDALQFFFLQKRSRLATFPETIRELIVQYCSAEESRVTTKRRWNLRYRAALDSLLLEKNYDLDQKPVLLHYTS